MAKKRFTEGLDSLFEDATPPRNSKRGRPSSDKEPRKRASGKDFSSDLSSFFQEAFEESFEAQVRKKQDPDAAGQETEQEPARLSGLDTLIRNTLKTASVTIDPKSNRRIVVSFPEDKLAKLKSIARIEKTRLKQVINAIVEEYIKEYERDKGELP